MKPPVQTRVAAVWEALHAKVTEALPNVQVIKGPVLDTANLDPDVVSVGSGTADQPGVLVAYRRDPGLRNAYTERVQLIVALSSHRGNESDIDAVIDQCRVMFGAVQQVLSASPVVENVWDGIEMGEAADWYPIQSSEGATCDVAFTVTARSVI